MTSEEKLERQRRQGAIPKRKPPAAIRNNDESPISRVYPHYILGLWTKKSHRKSCNMKCYV